MITCFTDSESEETWTRRAESHIRFSFRSTGDGGDWKVYSIDLNLGIKKGHIQQCQYSI